MSKIILQLKKFNRHLRSFLPNFIPNFFVRLGSAFLTPIHFSTQTGHFKSSWKKKSVDKNGIAIPWYTYGLIDFLQRRELSQKRVLEIGGGQSTLWWANMAKQVFTIEGDREWHKRLQANQNHENLEIRYISKDQNVLKALDLHLAESKITQFDVIIIDGMDRQSLVEKCISLLAIDGFIIIDDSDRYDFTDIFRKHNFSKVDFWGYAPGVTLTKCSSIQYRGECDIFSN